MPLRFVRNVAATAYRRSKEWIGERFGRPVLRGNGLQGRFMDLWENNPSGKYSEAKLEEIRRANLDSYLKTPLAQAYSRETVREIMSRHLQDHGIPVPARNPNPMNDMRNMVDLYHQAETAGVNVAGRRVKLDEKYHLGLGRWSEALHARLGNTLAETEKAEGTIYELAKGNRRSIGRILGDHEEYLLDIVRQKLGPAVRSKAALPQVPDVNTVARNIKTTLATGRDLTVAQIATLIKTRLQHPDEMSALKADVALLRKDLQNFRLSDYFQGTTDPERRRNRAAAFIGLINSETHENHFNLFSGVGRAKKAEKAKDFHGAIQRYTMLQKLFKTA